MNERPLIINLGLYTLSLLYGAGVKVRNWLFNINVLPGQSYKFPVISVGNLTVGGTGKTPHTEYLLGLLGTKFNVAMLSRGYKRKTSGYVFAGDLADGQTIGDEAYQIKRKFPHVAVAVDADRRRGIEKLMKEQSARPLSAIVLDDAFQHRYVEAGLNILITDSNRLITEDALLPYGRLREPVSSKNRANIVIVSKCPVTFKPMDFRLITKQLNLFPYQTLYFTTYKYGELIPVFPEEAGSEPLTKKDLKRLRATVLAVTGIVSPQDLHKHLKEYAGECIPMVFPDHYRFKPKDYDAIAGQFEKIGGTKAIVVTEKDAARLLGDSSMPEQLKPFIYALPVRVKFLLDQEEAFNKQIITYVSENTRNIGVLKTKN
jgi:tetraacyldisaccharide 4'-kinase